MKKVLIVCDKPHNRRVIESYLHKNAPADTIMHFDTMAFVLSLDNKFIKPMAKTEKGYAVGVLGSSCYFEQLSLLNTKLNTVGFIIEKERPCRTFSVGYDYVLFVCGTNTENLLSMHEYCERNCIGLEKVFHTPTPCVAEEFLRNIFDKSRWQKLS